VFDMDQFLPQLQFSFESIDAAIKSSELMIILIHFRFRVFSKANISTRLYAVNSLRRSVWLTGKISCWFLLSRKFL